MSSASHCFLHARVPVVDIQCPSTNNIIITTQPILTGANEYFDATLSAYHNNPPQVDNLISVHAAFAHTAGEAVICLSSDMREMEVLGSQPPSHPRYLEYLPAITPALFNIIGNVQDHGYNSDGKSFVLGGTSFMGKTRVPFAIQIQFDSSSKRWEKIPMPSVGSLVAIVGKLVGRQPDDGLFIVEPGHITYLGNASKSNPSTPSKRPATSPGRGSWLSTQMKRARTTAPAAANTFVAEQPEASSSSQTMSSPDVLSDTGLDAVDEYEVSEGVSPSDATRPESPSAQVSRVRKGKRINA